MTPERPRLADLGRELRGSWWAVPAVAGGLTILSTNFADFTVRGVLVSLAINALFTVCVGGSVTVLEVFGVGRFASRRGWWTWLLHAVAVAAGVVIGTELAIVILRPLIEGADPARYRAGIWRVGGVVSVVMAAIGITYERLREHAQATELRAERAHQQLLRAQLEHLQARLNPHFLFNSLNTVAALVEEDPTKAVLAIERLSDLLRYALEGAKRAMVPLSRELDAVRQYLAIEELRFGPRLRWDIAIDDSVGEQLVPPLVLQPLVENAVKHGIASRREGGRVRITGRRSGGQLEILVEDDGVGDSAVGGTQTGEANVRERLELAFGAEASFSAAPGPDQGYRVRIAIPVAPTGARQ
ncbi:MAG: histidine kinase [Myxococcota bacterium]